MIYYLPLEHLDKRYTKDMDTLLMNEFKRQGKKFVKIDGEQIEGDIKVGAFLDANSTNYYKFTQMRKVCELFAKGEVSNGDVFFISDLWFPGIEAIPYMAYFNKLKVFIKGILHAGSFTETDYVANLKHWAKDIEMGWFKFIDEIYVGSNHIKRELIEKGYVNNYGLLYKTGLPFDPQDCYDRVSLKPYSEKENIVVFNGRLDDEKQPWLFDDIAKTSFNMKFIKTMEQNLSKTDYYELLSRAKIVYFAGLQENFGYGAIEAAAYGCNIVAPRRLSYKEYYPIENLYSTHEGSKELVDYYSQSFSLGEQNYNELIEIALQQKDNTKRIVERV